MAQRFENASLVLGPVNGRAAALCRFAGRPAADENTTTLAVLDAALDFAEQMEGVDDVRELLDLWKVARVWGHPPVPDVELPRLGQTSTAVAGHLQTLLEQLTPQELRELGIALSVDHDMVALALELVEEAAAGSREFQASTMAEFEAENRLNEDCRPDRIRGRAVRSRRAPRPTLVAGSRSRPSLCQRASPRAGNRPAGMGQDRPAALRRTPLVEPGHDPRTVGMVAPLATHGRHARALQSRPCPEHGRRTLASPTGNAEPPHRPISSQKPRDRRSTNHSTLKPKAPNRRPIVCPVCRCRPVASGGWEMR